MLQIKINFKSIAERLATLISLFVSVDVSTMSSLIVKLGEVETSKKYFISDLRETDEVIFTRFRRSMTFRFQYRDFQDSIRFASAQHITMGVQSGVWVKVF